MEIPIWETSNQSRLAIAFHAVYSVDVELLIWIEVGFDIFLDSL
jgi:hypothetical protein